MESQLRLIWLRNFGVSQSYLWKFRPRRLNHISPKLGQPTIDLTSHSYRSRLDRFGAVLLDTPYIWKVWNTWDDSSEGGPVESDDWSVKLSESESDWLSLSNMFRIVSSSLYWCKAWIEIMNWMIFMNRLKNMNVIKAIHIGGGFLLVQKFCFRQNKTPQIQ